MVAGGEGETQFGFMIDVDLNLTKADAKIRTLVDNLKAKVTTALQTSEANMANLQKSIDTYNSKMSGLGSGGKGITLEIAGIDTLVKEIQGLSARLGGAMGGRGAASLPRQHPADVAEMKRLQQRVDELTQHVKRSVMVTERAARGERTIAERTLPWRGRTQQRNVAVPSVRRSETLLTTEELKNLSHLKQNLFAKGQMDSKVLANPPAWVKQEMRQAMRE